VFYADDGNRDDENVYYSYLAYCITKKEAIAIIANTINVSRNTLDAEELELHTKSGNKSKSKRRDTYLNIRNKNIIIIKRIRLIEIPLS